MLFFLNIYIQFQSNLVISNQFWLGRSFLRNRICCLVQI